MRPNNRREPTWIEPEITFVGHTNELDSLAQNTTVPWPELIHDDTLTDEDYQRFLTLAATADLTTRQVQCLYGYYWQEKTEREIAKELDIDCAAIHRHIEAGKSKLYPILKAAL